MFERILGLERRSRSSPPTSPSAAEAKRHFRQRIFPKSCFGEFFHGILCPGIDVLGKAWWERSPSASDPGCGVSARELPDDTKRAPAKDFFKHLLHIVAEQFPSILLFGARASRTDILIETSFAFLVLLVPRIAGFLRPGIS